MNIIVPIDWQRKLPAEFCDLKFGFATKSFFSQQILVSSIQLEGHWDIRSIRTFCLKILDEELV